MGKNITSRCPVDLVGIGIDKVYLRANFELELLKESIIGLDIMTYGAKYVDKGLIDGYYEGEFSIFPLKKCSESLYFLLGEWERMATPPNLSGC